MKKYSFRKQNKADLYIDTFYAENTHLWELLTNKQEFLDKCSITEISIIPYNILETFEDKFEWNNP